MQYGEQQCEPGHAFGPCVRNNYLIHYIYSGKGVFKTNSKEYHLHKGQFFLICPEQLTYYKADTEEPWLYRWIEFNGSFADSVLKSAGLSEDSPIFTDNEDMSVGKALLDIVRRQNTDFEILMSNATRQDNTGLLISEEYSPAYEINADLEKMIGSMSVYTIYGGYKLAYNALSPINASEWIPMGYIAPAAGEYTFRLDDIDKIVEQVEHVYLIDYEANNIVDLMDEEYKFTTDKEQNNNRFAINVVLVQDKDNTTTGLDMIQGNNAAPIKFIHQDKMYIYNEGIIYDATGKQVTNINK